MKKKRNQKNDVSRRGIKGLMAFLFFVVVVGLLILMNYFMNQTVYITRYQIENEKIPKAFDGYTIVQVTDVHSIRTEEQSDLLYTKIVEENPDAIVLTGDLLDSKYYTEEQNDYIEGMRKQIPGQETVDFVERLTEYYQVYFVYGNHEMVLLDDVENNSFKVAMEKIGVIFLNNAGVKITNNNESIYLMGIQDPATLYKDESFSEYNTHTERINAMMSQIMTLKEEDLYTIVLSHRPEYFETYRNYEVDLYLTGHAHGGQVRLPVIGGLYAPGQGTFPKYTSGLWEDGETTMVIGRGIGNAVEIPRIFNPPEINTIVLRSVN